MDFNEIPKFTRSASYGVDVSWQYLVSDWLPMQLKDGLELDPDFQRGHVWSEDQQRRYIEFVLRGGQTGREIQTNHPTWHHGLTGGPYVLVDGKQRIEAVSRFMKDQFRIFASLDPRGLGYVRSEFTGYLRHYASFRWCVNDLKTREEVLQWYIDLNAGGVVHSDEEISRVRSLLEQERTPNVS